MKRTVVAVMMCLILCFAAGVNAEIKQEVDAFDGKVKNYSYTNLLDSYVRNAMESIYLNSSSDGLVWIQLSYYSNHTYIFKFLSSMQIKIDDDTTNFVSARLDNSGAEYITYQQETQFWNWGAFIIQQGDIERILNAKTISLRAITYYDDVVYNVPDYILQEWKDVLSTPLVAGYQSLYKNVTWPQRGTDDYYCIDICDENWNVYQGFQGLQCRQARSWSPKDYINKTLGVKDGIIKGFKFNWRVWSNSGYGGEGFEGSITCE